MCSRRPALLWLMALLGLCLAGCGQSAASQTARASALRLLKWTGRDHVRRVLDLSAPRSDGSIVVATAGRLALLSPAGGLRPFASAYAAPSGLEPYIALSTDERVA